MSLIDQISEFITQLPVGQIMTSTLGSGWLVSVWFKKRSDKEIERLKKQLEIYYFNETLGKTRADDQQSIAIKKIWDTIADWAFELQNFVRCAKLLSISNDNQNIVESLAALNLKLKAIEIELNKFAIHVDLEMYDDIMGAYKEINKFYDDFLEKLKKVIQDNPNDIHKISEMFSSSADLEKIELILRPLAQLMRKKLKVIDNT